jgi:zinc protease
MKNKYLRFLSSFLFLAIFITGCQQKPGTGEKELDIPFEKYTLENGLDVILHQDRSDPLVAVAIQFHVGSNREKPGRTGFAHFFEHMLFQKSENIPPGSFFKYIEDWGGTFNGGTWQDGTVYFEVVPKDALERVLWMESDRMGYFINAITVKDLEDEKPVVKNEKRQGVDNRPYGHTQHVTLKALYPEGHPYSWTVIGDLEDLQNATLEDVREFYDSWYGPNNATMVIAGDFEIDEVKTLVDKYFGEIPSRGNDTPPVPQPITLEETKVLYHEDNFASLPEIRLTFPTVEWFNPDQWALDALGQILSQGKRAWLYKILVEDKKLAPSVQAYNSSGEIAGTFTVRVRANEGVNMDTVHQAILEAFNKFETEGFSEKDLDRIKAGLETDFYNSISSSFFKAYQLAIYNEFAGDPEFYKTDISKIKNLTQQDIADAYNKYIKGRHYLVTNFVPKGRTDLLMSNAVQANVVEEDITQASVPTEVIQREVEGDYPKTPSTFDRTVEPPLGPEPLVTPPRIWTATLDNKMNVYGIEANELPLINFSIRIKGGFSAEILEKVGVTNLLTDLMMEGTKNKTPEELEDAIGQLGANIRLFTSNEYIGISGNCLTRNYSETLALVEEILLEPRWDEKEFERLKERAINQIMQRDVNPNAVAGMVMNKVLYGEDHIFGHPLSGTIESVSSITVEDLKNYYAMYFAPNISNFHIAGNISKDEALGSLESLSTKWGEKIVELPEYKLPESRAEPMVYFVDIPQSKQSTINIGRLTIKANDKNFYPLEIGNYRLGDGTSGILFQILREEKGYTYGAYSRFIRGNQIGRFYAGSSVRSNVTLEAVEIFKEEIGKYPENYSEEQLEVTKVVMIKQNTRRFETNGSLVGLLESISTYDLPLDYIDYEQRVLQSITVDEVKSLLEEYLDLNTLVFVIVGDKETQYDRLRVEGVGDPILVDKYGNQLAL